MKPTLALAALIALCTALAAQSPAPMKPADSPKPPAAALTSTIVDWTKMKVTPTPKGVRRDVFDGVTTSLENLHCHITTLNPGENSGEPRLHLMEEVIIIKEGLVEASCDGKVQTVGPGSVIFFAAHAVTRQRNVGDTPATYIVINYHTPLTPKS